MKFNIENIKMRDLNEIIYKIIIYYRKSSIYNSLQNNYNNNFIRLKRKFL